MAGTYEIYGIRIEEVPAPQPTAHPAQSLGASAVDAAESPSERAKQQKRDKDGKFTAGGSAGSSGSEAKANPVPPLPEDLQPRTEHFDALLREAQSRSRQEGLPKSVLAEIRQKHAAQGKNGQELESDINAEVSKRLESRARRQAARAYFVQHLQEKAWKRGSRMGPASRWNLPEPAGSTSRPISAMIPSRRH